MGMTTKIIIACLVLAMGIFLCVDGVKRYKRNPLDAFLGEIFGFNGVWIIGGVIFVLAAGGWLIYLLKCAIWGRC